ncbi:MAG: YdcF family protein [Syntrophales bacterium]
MGRLIVLAGILILAALSFEVVSDHLVGSLEYRYTPLNVSEMAGKSTIKWIVVLGAGHVSDPYLPATSQLSDTATLRLIEAVRIYRELPGCKLLLSGGKIFDPASEAEVMASVARTLGINPEDIVLEAKSRNTEDQAKIIPSIVGRDTFILVTSASHMPRAMALFKKSGVSPLPAPAGYTVKRSQGTIHPGGAFLATESLAKSETAFYEYAAILWAKIRGRV